MSDSSGSDHSPANPSPAQPPGVGKRRLLIKAALIGSTVPIVTTISRSALAAECSPSQQASAAVSGRNCTMPKQPPDKIK